MKILGVTLARSGSKGIPNKNIRKIAGKPLIKWTTQEAEKSKYLNNYIVSTDSTEIMRIAGVDTVIRPKELAEDDTPSLYALVHAVRYMEAVIERNYDIVAMIPCTSPLKTVEDIDGAIELLMVKDAQSVIGVTEAYPIERIKTIESGRLVDTYDEPQDGQRQFLPKYYKRNGSIYVVRRDSLDRLFGHPDSYAWVMPRERSINIDDEYDWSIAERMLQNVV